MSAAVVFEPGAHVYTVDGQVVPSATQVLSRAGLTDFSHIPEPFRQRALDRGRRVHAAVNFFLEGTLDHASVDPTEYGYVESCARFLETAQVDIKGAELLLYHPGIRVAGTTDALGIWREQRAIVDWCCGDLEESRKDLQTSFYAEAARLQGHPDWWEFTADSPIVRLGVRLRKDGKLPKPEPYRDTNDFRLFASAAAVVHEQLRTGRKGVHP